MKSARKERMAANYFAALFWCGGANALNVHAAGGVNKPMLHDGLTPATIQLLRAG
jgi:hypothetical protein